MKHRGNLKITLADFVRILEYWNAPSFKREIEIFKTTQAYHQPAVLPFMMWMCSLQPRAKEEMMMLALSHGNWARFQSWEEKHLNDFEYCKMLFPINERAEEFYAEMEQNRVFDDVIKEN